jgi:hypothetical protein
VVSGRSFTRFAFIALDRVLSFRTTIWMRKRLPIVPKAFEKRSLWSDEFVAGRVACSIPAGYLRNLPIGKFKIDRTCAILFLASQSL